MATTGRQIVTNALRKARVLTKGEAADADEINDGLTDLNNLVASWANDTLLAFVRTSETFPIVGATKSYTIGSGGTFNTTRPIVIISAYVTIGGTDYVIDNIQDARYDTSFVDKTTPGYPSDLLYEAANPLATITLYPVPISSGTLTIRSEKPLAAFDLDSSIDLPPGWDRALIHNLAVEISPDYGQKVSEDLREIAANSKAKIERATIRNRRFDTPPLTGGVVTNVLSGPR